MSKESNDIVATAQIIEESGNIVNAIKNIKQLENISIKEAFQKVMWFVNNKSIHIVFNRSLK